MRMAFALQPDAIYILGDGAFTDDTVRRLLRLPPTEVTIHTMGFAVTPSTEQGFRLIAEKFHGVFAEVQCFAAGGRAVRSNQSSSQPED